MHHVIRTALAAFAMSFCVPGAVAQPLIDDYCVEFFLPLDVGGIEDFSLSSIEITGDTLILGAKFFTDPDPFPSGDPVCYSNLSTAFNMTTQSALFEYIPDAPF